LTPAIDQTLLILTGPVAIPAVVGWLLPSSGVHAVVHRDLIADAQLITLGRSAVRGRIYYAKCLH